MFQREFEKKIGKKKKHKKMARSACTAGLVHNTRLADSSRLSAGLAQRVGSAQRKKVHEEKAQCVLSAQKHAQCEVNVKSKLHQAYKRSRNLKEKTHRVSELSSVEIQSLNLSLRGNPLSLAIPPFCCYQSSFLN